LLIKYFAVFWVRIIRTGTTGH